MTSFGIGKTDRPIASKAGAASAVFNLGGAAIALGSFGVVVTSVFYALSPPAAALPAQPFDEARALLGAVNGAATMHAAGAIGIFADVALATGSMLAMLDLARQGKAAACGGWAAIALASLLFTFVDALAGFVLAPLAASREAVGAFVGFKLLFDALFLLGTTVFGLGAALALSQEIRAARPYVAKSLAYAGVASGAAGVVAALACFFGFPLEQGVGLSIGLGAAIFTLVGWRIARSEPWIVV